MPTEAVFLTRLDSPWSKRSKRRSYISSLMQNDPSWQLCGKTHKIIFCLLIFESNEYRFCLHIQAVRLLGPPARFEASKLEVLLKGEEDDTYSSIVPRTYTLSHCDFTANLTLTISNNIQYDQVTVSCIYELYLLFSGF